jgi:MscS family membrane protein
MNETIFLLTNLQWIKIFALIFSLILFDHFLRYNSQKIVRRFLKKEHVTFSHLDEKKLAKCIGPFVAFLIWVITLPVLNLPPHIHHYLHRASNIFLTLLSIRTAFYLTDVFGSYFMQKAVATESKLDDILVPLLNKAAKTIVILVGLVFLGESFHLDMKGLIAGLGIGGIAVAFAAKDSLANIFGSITVLMDQPFRIGDNIKLENGITGDVIEVGLRSTRLRSPEDSIITVPNGSLTNSSINNFGMRQYRRFETQLLLDITTSTENINQLCDELKYHLKQTAHVKNDNIQVFLNNFIPGALEIKVIVFFSATEGAQELQYRHQLLTDILKFTEKLKITLTNPAIPSK